MKIKVLKYLRISTKHQLESHSFDYQDYLIDKYLSHTYGEDYEVVNIIKDVCSGTKGYKSQPELYQLFYETGYTFDIIVVSSPDRLTRNVEFAEKLLDNFTIKTSDLLVSNKEQFLECISFAAREADIISQRTNQALAEVKRKGVKLGGANKDIIRDYSKPRKKKTSVAYLDYLQYKNILENLYFVEYKTLQEIANHLNNAGYRTVRGAMWSPTHVNRALKYLGLKF